MSSFPCLERTFSASGQVRFTLGDRLADRYLEFVATFVGHPAYGIETLRADLHRFVFLLGISDGEELFNEPTP